MGASAALAGLAGCTAADEPYLSLRQAAGRFVLEPNYFATTAHPFVTERCLCWSRASVRPIKIDGNPEHPYNSGRVGPVLRRGAAGLNMIRNRSQHVLYAAKIASGREFAQDCAESGRDQWMERGFISSARLSLRERWQRRFGAQ